MKSSNPKEVSYTTETSHTSMVGVSNGTITLENCSWQFLLHLNACPLCNLETCHECTGPQEGTHTNVQSRFHQDSKKLKHSKCPPFEEWRNGKTVVSSFCGKLTSVKRNKLTAHTTRMNLTDTMLSERSQTRRE